jgi:hypothetical protein
MSSIQMPPAQDLFNVLNQHYETQYKELRERYQCLETMNNFFSMAMAIASKKEVDAKVAGIASQLHELIIAGEQIKILENLLSQGIAHLKRSPISQERTFTNNFSRINPNFIIRCMQLFNQNVKNVQLLSEAQKKVKTLEEQYQKNLQQEVLPSWVQFAEKFGTPVQKESLKPLDSSNLTEATPTTQATNISSGIFNVATSVVSSLASGIFSIAISGPKNNFEPKNYLAAEKVKPLPPMEDLTAFFNTHRPQILTESPLVACFDANADPSKNLTCTIVYQKLHALYKSNYKDLDQKWTDVSDLLTRLDTERLSARQKTGESETLKKFGEEFQTGLDEIGREVAQYKVDLKAIQALELYLKIGVEHLTLQPIPTEDLKTIEILDGKLRASISQDQVEEQRQLDTLKKDLEYLTKLIKFMENSCSLAERMYQDHRYQVSNLRQGYVATLGVRQFCKVHGSYLNNPTDPKLPKPHDSQIQLKNFDSKDMELLSTLDHESCLIAAIKRVQISAFDESDDNIGIEESEEKFQEETLPDGLVDTSEDEDAGDAINAGDQQKPIGIHVTEAEKTSENDEVNPGDLLKVLGLVLFPKDLEDDSDLEDTVNVPSVSEDREKTDVSVSPGVQHNKILPVPVKPETSEAEKYP